MIAMTTSNSIRVKPRLETIPAISMGSDNSGTPPYDSLRYGAQPERSPDRLEGKPTGSPYIAMRSARKGRVYRRTEMVVSHEVAVKLW